MISSTEFKTHLGEYLTEAMHKAVFVKRRSNEAVLISKKEYDFKQVFMHWQAEILIGFAQLCF